MPFIASELIKGKIFVPEKPSCIGQKHPCKDCFSCQQCGDDRCSLCVCEKEKDSSMWVEDECHAE